MPDDDDLTDAGIFKRLEAAAKERHSQQEQTERKYSKSTWERIREERSHLSQQERDRRDFWFRVFERVVWLVAVLVTALTGNGLPSG